MESRTRSSRWAPSTPISDDPNIQSAFESLKDMCARQQQDIDALQKTNEVLHEANETLQTKIKGLDEELMDFRTNLGSAVRSVSLGELPDARRDSGEFKLPEEKPVTRRYTADLGSSTIEGYSSGEDTEIFETLVEDYHELLPIKQGWTKKKSEKSAPTGKNKKSKDVHDVNHPLGTIFLRNYHLCVRKDDKRWDFTLVPTQSAIDMGLADKSIKVRFRCKNRAILMDWVKAIQSAMGASRHGFITYEVREDYIYDSMTGISGINVSENEEKQVADKTRSSAEVAWTQDDSDEDEVDDNANANKSKVITKIFTIAELKKLIDEKQKLKEDVDKVLRSKRKIEGECQKYKSELEIKEEELKRAIDTYDKEKESLQNKIEELKSRETGLNESIGKLRDELAEKDSTINQLKQEIFEKDQKEKDILKQVELLSSWNSKIDENSITNLARVYPKYSNTQLFEACQNGCVSLSDQTYQICNPSQEYSRVTKAMLTTYTILIRSHVKEMMEFAQLQQEHEDTMEELTLLKEYLDDFEGPDHESQGIIGTAIVATPF